VGKKNLLLFYIGEGFVLTAYLDNSATTRPCESAVRKMNEAVLDTWGNPSSLHKMGFDASLLLSEARKEAAKALRCEEKEIYFSTGGTASNNTAIFGCLNKKSHAGKRIVSSAIEHPSVLRCLDRLENDGFEVIRLLPSEDGNISIDSISQAIDENTVLVSLMAVNNETGCILPFDKVKKVIRRKKSNALFHVDAVQAFGKMPVNAAFADMITASAHKIHSVKGAGLLYVSKSVKLKPYLLGGGQENSLFSGTQNVPAIAAFGKAIEECRDIETHAQHVRKLNLYLRERLSEFENVRINSPSDALEYILNISVLGVPSQVSVNALSERGVYVSAGSACSKGHRSDTLTSMNLDSERIDSAIRVSLSRYSSKEEIDLFISSLREISARVAGK